MLHTPGGYLVFAAMTHEYVFDYHDGDGFVTASSRKSLTLLGSVGEPINPEAWEWYDRIVGEECCPVVDTWW